MLGYDFGWIDGDFHTARLQHPLGVAADNGNLLVADTYNSAIRELDLSNGSRCRISRRRRKFTCVNPVCVDPRAAGWSDRNGSLVVRKWSRINELSSVHNTTTPGRGEALCYAPSDTGNRTGELRQVRENGPCSCPDFQPVP